MAVQSSVFVIFFAGASVAGAAAGFHRDAILDKVAGAVQPLEVNPISAMTGAPLEGLPLLQIPDGRSQFRQKPITETTWAVPTRPVASQLAAQTSDILPVEAKPQAPQRSLSPLKEVDLEGMPPIELMKSAAKGRHTPKPSQLDLILSALPMAEKDKNQSVEVSEGTDDTHPDAQSEQAAVVKPPKVRAAPVPRPVAHSDQQTKHPEAPGYSAKHYHNLRYHLSGQKNKKSEIACIAELQLMASYTQIYFDSGSSILDERGASAARQIAAKAQSCPEAHVSIIGFTDPGGAEEVNQRISWSRANGVFHSIKEAGFSMENIEVSSHMEDHPEFCVHYEGIDRRVVFDVHEEADD
ncbi:OmpA family protein [uncultured Roseobacter sp.]|uniref:OmpA family protein n=1 Tax=uncultured Roseobacter sp. TaxID=114847 RepID=UPI00262B9475|nr:OmpA family protein [uncultured Roseobacter sp.]